MMARIPKRAGFTLVELLVGLSIATALAAFVLLAYPGARDQDRVRNTVSDVIGHLKMAQAMAVRDGQPRGIRFLIDGAGKPLGDPRLVTELQYIELPSSPSINPRPLSHGVLGTSSLAELDPRVRIEYEASDGTNPDRFNRTPIQPAGTITFRRCVIENLTLDQAYQVKAVPGYTLILPAFGFWAKITSTPNQTLDLPPVGNPAGPNSAGRYRLEVNLETYPDAAMGGSTLMTTHHFAVIPGVGNGMNGAVAGGTSSATPLIGEPSVLLPQGICVDLNAADPIAGFKVGSLGPVQSVPADFDVVFDQDGKLLGPNGQLYLLVRSYRKVPTMRLSDGGGLYDAFQRGGEQFFVTIRRSGALGSSLVAWPDSTGSYAAPWDAFTIARQDLNQ